jgi:hypothetical protein
MSAAVLVPYIDRDGLDAAFVTSTMSLPQPGTDSLRLAQSREVLEPWVCELVREWAPALVVVEQPFAAARHVPMVSYYAIGVLLELLGKWYGNRVEMVTPAQWKKAAMGAGRGGVKKPGPCKVQPGKTHAWGPAERGEPVRCLKCREDYAVLTWARQAGYVGRLWDEADALGIATAGGVLLERELRAAA